MLQGCRPLPIVCGRSRASGDYVRRGRAALLGTPRLARCSLLDVHRSQQSGKHGATERVTTTRRRRPRRDRSPASATRPSAIIGAPAPTAGRRANCDAGAGTARNCTGRGLPVPIASALSTTANRFTRSWSSTSTTVSTRAAGSEVRYESVSRQRGARYRIKSSARSCSHSSSSGVRSRWRCQLLDSSRSALHLQSGSALGPNCRMSAGGGAGRRRNRR